MAMLGRSGAGRSVASLSVSSPRSGVRAVVYRFGLTIGTIVIGLGAAAMLVPFVWTAMTALKTQDEVFRLPITWLPDNPLYFANYRKLFAEYPTVRWFANSVLVSLLSIGSSIVFCSMSGYALAKLRFRGRTVCFLAVLSMLMMPFELTFLPLFLMFSKAGLVNTYLGIAGPNLMSAVGVFIMRQFMQTIPNEYLDAARIDGASEYRIFRAIAVPMAQSAIVTLAILKFTLSWNVLLWPMIVAQDDSMMTLTVGMQKFITFYATDYGLLTSSATLSVVPLVLLFVVGQRWVINSTILSGLKG